LAERDIRMARIKQKISGCFRTLTGAERSAAIRCYTAAAGRNNIDIYQALKPATVMLCDDCLGTLAVPDDLNGDYAA